MAATKTTGNKKTPSTKPTNNNSSGEMFLMSVLNMSWQLAIVVLLPVIGGFKADQWLNTLPALTIIGFILAIVGMTVIVLKQLKKFGPAPKYAPRDEDDDD